MITITGRKIKKVVSEKSREKRLKNVVEDLDGLYMKFTSTGLTGVPDRIVLMPGDLVYFVELKKDTGRFSERQKFMAAEFLKRNCIVHKVHNEEAYTKFVKRLKRDQQYNNG